MKTEDYLVLIAWVLLSLFLRWAVLSGLRWAKVAVNLAAIAITIALLKVPQFSIAQSCFAIAAFVALMGLGFWLSKYLLRLLHYASRVLRGAAIQAKIKADKLANTE